VAHPSVIDCMDELGMQIVNPFIYTVDGLHHIIPSWAAAILIVAVPMRVAMSYWKIRQMTTMHTETFEHGLAQGGVQNFISYRLKIGE